MEVYKSKEILALESFYGTLLYAYNSYTTIYKHLDALAARMWEGVQQKELIVFKEINNYHTDYLGKPESELIQLQLNEDDCRQAVANQYGCKHWTVVKDLTMPYNIEFELAINDLLAGNLTALRNRIAATPKLVTMRSQYGHRATLLHYAGNNGVELWRQKIPSNLATIMKFLINNGADVNAKMPIYGGEHTTYELLVTSAHPYDANCIDELKSVFDDII